MKLGFLRGSVVTGSGAPMGQDGILEAPTGNLRFADWLYRSKAAGVLWLVARLWLGYEWLNAGYQKLWGAENSGFWNNSGAAVKGYAAAGITGSATGKGGASYGWWAAFLHNFVVPNASWIAKLIAVSEFALGLLLIVGLFTGAAAAAGLMLNLIYMFSGTAGVNPAYAIVSVFLVLAWRNAGYLGLDSLALPWVRRLLHHGGRAEGVVHQPPTGALPAH
ncbi:MAG TPA: DoxX family membrane protein [Acidimicrobiales bacterium]|nr:DoxX family membrane protein [Acidimicrobiales bacterium]